MKIVTVIRVEVISKSPLFIGNGSDLFLVDDDAGKAYLPATSIAGSFRAYLKSIGESDCELFGEQGHDGKAVMSKLYVNDAFADMSGIDRRNGLRIDPERGSNVDGSKIDRYYLSSGLKFELIFEIHSENEDENKKLLGMLYKCLKALNEGYIRLGGHKSNGLGRFELLSTKETFFDMKMNDRLYEFLNDDYSKFNDVIDKIREMPINEEYVEFIVEGGFSTPVMIKSPEYVEDEGENKSIKSGDKYIIPGSSFKGVLRSRVEKIANYFGSMEQIRELFGEVMTVDKYESMSDEICDKTEKSSKFKKNQLGRIFVSEAELVLDEQYQKKKYSKIRIDRFTGGVIKTALMFDNPVQGSASFRVIYRKLHVKEKDDYAIGMIALALRDLGTENLVVGGGNSIGRGRFKADKMCINDKNSLVEIDFNSEKILKGEKLLNEYVKAAKVFSDKKEALV